MTKGKNATAKPKPVVADAIGSKQPPRKAKSKLEQLEAMLRRPDGATIEKIGKALHWQTHSVRGAMSGSLKTKKGLNITSEKTPDGRRASTELPPDLAGNAPSPQEHAAG